MSPAAAPPSAQEIQRKLSVCSKVPKVPKPKPVVFAATSGTESESESVVSPEILSIPGSQSVPGSSSVPSQPPLSSIAELGSGDGEDSEDDDEHVEAVGKIVDVQGRGRGSMDESVIKAGYLWKKGERRKTWKKRWFVLRPAHLAYYKTSAEYELLRLVDLAEVHSCTQVNLKKHENTFGLVSPSRTFYLQASSPSEVQEWVQAFEDARHALMATSTQTSMTAPIPIPLARSGSVSQSAPLPTATSSSPPPPNIQNITSSDSDEPSSLKQQAITISPQAHPLASSPTKTIFPAVDPSKTILSGYLMKCGSKRKNWRKRWFVLTSEKLVYTGSHMDTKPGRIFPFSEILDALEYELPIRHNPVHVATSATSSHPGLNIDDADDPHRTHSFKIVTTRRTLLLNAPSEEEEIKWLGSIRALIARRTGAGMVPGDAGRSSGKATANPDLTPSSSGGLKGKARRMSASADDGSVEKKG